MKTFQQLISDNIQSDTFDRYFMEPVLDAFNEATSQLQSENQLLLDEINRLNAIIEKQGKVIQALRDE